MDTLTTSLRLLANNIDCDDGVAIAVVLQAADEIERLRLTDDERQAIKWIVGDDLSADGVSIQATLRGLLSRLSDTGSV